LATNMTWWVVIISGSRSYGVTKLSRRTVNNCRIRANRSSLFAVGASLLITLSNQPRPNGCERNSYFLDGIRFLGCCREDAFRAVRGKTLPPFRSFDVY
jgi:hypothetical protein